MSAFIYLLSSFLSCLKTPHRNESAGTNNLVEQDTGMAEFPDFPKDGLVLPKVKEIGKLLSSAPPGTFTCF